MEEASASRYKCELLLLELGLETVKCFWKRTGEMYMRYILEQAEFPAETLRTSLIFITQCHVRLNSLFKVLLNIPSRYLFAIGLSVIFRLMRSLPHVE